MQHSDLRERAARHPRAQNAAAAAARAGGASLLNALSDAAAPPLAADRGEWGGTIV